MAGRFSVNNLFKGIRQAVDNSLKFLEKQIWNRIKPYLVPVLQILSIVTQLLQTFKQEIKQLANLIRRIPGEIVKQITRTIDRGTKLIERLINAAVRRIDNFVKSSQRQVIKTVQDGQKTAQKINKSADDLIRDLKKLNTQIDNFKKGTYELPKKATTTITKAVDEAATKTAPKIVNSAKKSILSVADDVVKSNPAIKAATKTLSQADDILKPLAKNSKSLSVIFSKAPGLMDDLAKFTSPFVRGGATAVKAIPIIGALVQALDWEYYKGEFKQLFRQVDTLDNQVNQLYKQMINSRLADKSDRERLINVERLLLRLNGIPANGGSSASTGAFTQAQINAIANAVAVAVSSKGLVNPQQIANAVSASLAPQLAKPTTINYQEIQRLMVAAVSPLASKTDVAANTGQVINTINGLKPLFPNSVTLGRDVATQVSQNVANTQQSAFSQIGNQYSQITQLLNTINNSNSNISNTVNKISNTTVNNGITLSQLQKTESNIINVVRATALETQKTLPLAIGNAKLATSGDSQTIANLIRNLNVNPRITVNPTPVTVAVPQTLINQINAINPTVRNTIQTELAKLPKQQPDPNAKLAADRSLDIFNMMGGNELKNGIPWNPEALIKGMGEQIYNGSQPLVKTLPAAMALVATPLFMRGGLHKFPASLPSDLNNPNAAPTTVNHAVGLQQAYHGLIDQRLGSPSTIKVTGADGQITTSRSRSVNESLDTVTAQLVQADAEMEILQQTVAKLAAETMAIAQMVLVDHDILESLRDFCGYRYTETKRSKPTEISLGKDSLFDWFKQSNLHYVGSKFDGQMDLTEMLQKLFLEIGKVSNSNFQRFDPNDENQKIIGQNFSNPKGEDDDDEWKRFVKFVKETPSAVKSPTDPQPNLERYTNNDTTAINVSGVEMPQG